MSEPTAPPAPPRRQREEKQQAPAAPAPAQAAGAVAGQAPLAAAAPKRVPCVGLPVQYMNGAEVIPGTLQRRSITEPDLWDVKISLSGAHSLVTRAGVRFSEELKPGCWSFLPV